MNPPIWFRDHLCRNSRRRLLFGLFGIVCIGLSGLHAAAAQRSSAVHPNAQRPHAQQHAGQPHTPHAHVYLLRGLFNVFSLGMDTLAEELNKRGVETSVDNYADWQSLADRAAARFKAGTENPIILIGHSLGADAVIEMAAYLGRRDVPVALVIPFDGTHTLVAPANVARIVNLTQRNYAYARPGPGFKGSLANVDVSSDANIDHINIDKAARTHARAISEVMAAVGHPSAAPKDQQAPAPAKPAAVAPAEEATGAAPSRPEASSSKPAPPAISGPTTPAQDPSASNVASDKTGSPPSPAPQLVPQVTPQVTPQVAPQVAPASRLTPTKPRVQPTSPAIEN